MFCCELKCFVVPDTQCGKISCCNTWNYCKCNCETWMKKLKEQPKKDNRKDFCQDCGTALTGDLSLNRYCGDCEKNHLFK